MFENDLKILKAMLLMYDTMRIANREQLKEEILYQISRIEEEN
jgi:hypothetical protein